MNAVCRRSLIENAGLGNVTSRRRGRQHEDEGSIGYPAKRRRSFFESENKCIQTSSLSFTPPPVSRKRRKRQGQRERGCASVPKKPRAGVWDRKSRPVSSRALVPMSDKIEETQSNKSNLHFSLTQNLVLGENIKFVEKMKQGTLNYLDAPLVRSATYASPNNCRALVVYHPPDFCFAKSADGIKKDVLCQDNVKISRDSMELD